jgi:nickel-dependent lactate racemase
LTIETLAYGNSAIALDFPDTEHAEILLPPALQSLDDPEEAVLSALEHPLYSESLAEHVSADDRILIIVPDKTRDCGARVLLSVLTGYLNKAGIQDDQICLLFATGAHAAQSDREVTEIIGPAIKQRLQIIEHDARDDGCLYYAGTTRFNTPVYLNKKFQDADKVIVLGTVVHHYFAGFGGGMKMLVPGCAGYQTITRNHALTISPENQGIHPDCRSGNIRNPVQDDIREAAGSIPVTFLLKTVMNDAGDIAAVFSGEMSATHAAACAYIDSRLRRPIGQRFDLVITGCGGFPKDINFIQAHKALYNAAQLVKRNGVLILVAQCSQGIGSETFLQWFEYDSPSVAVAAMAKDYRLNATTALSVITMAEKANIIAVTALPPEIVLKMGLSPAATVAEALEIARPWLPANYKTCILPNASITLPVVN